MSQDRDDNISRLYFPMLAPDSNETSGKMLDRWDAFDKLPERIQEKVSGSESAKRIRTICDSFDLSDQQIIPVSRAIRRYYFGEITANGILAVIAQETGLAPDVCERIYHSILGEIINDNGTTKEPEARTSRMTIAEAIRKFPEIGEQQVTSGQIELRSFPYPVRPSVSNWISDYTFSVGLKNKDSLTRNNYLFRSPNAEKLPEKDRSRLSEIFKSLDEDSPLSVDENRKLVVFSDQLPKPDPVPAAIRPKIAPVPLAVPKAPQTAPVAGKGQDDILDRRLGAWRKDIGTKPENEKVSAARTGIDQIGNSQEPAGKAYDSRMTFSSPQRLPIERNVPTIPSNTVFSRTATDQRSPRANEPVDLSKAKPVPGNPPAAKNVVDLREE